MQETAAANIMTSSRLLRGGPSGPSRSLHDLGGGFLESFALSTHLPSPPSSPALGALSLLNAAYHFAWQLRMYVLRAHMCPELLEGGTLSGTTRVPSLVGMKEMLAGRILNSALSLALNPRLAA